MCCSSEGSIVSFRVCRFDSDPSRLKVFVNSFQWGEIVAAKLLDERATLMWQMPSGDVAVIISGPQTGSIVVGNGKDKIHP